MESQEQTKQHPVDTGIENAKKQIEEASRGVFKVSEDSVNSLQRILREIWEKKITDRKIPEEFIPALFELVALVQFHRIKDGKPLWDKVELEKLVDSIWDRLKEFLNPPTPTR